MKIVFAAAVLAATVLAVTSAGAGERYGSKPPVVLSPDLAAPWVMQLGHGRYVTRQAQTRRRVDTGNRQVLIGRRTSPTPPTVRQYQAAPQRVMLQRPVQPARAEPQMDPAFLPREVSWNGSEKPGTIIIDTNQRYLYLVKSGGMAQRYGVGVAKPGFEWAGTHKITRKAEWPSWTPPKEMITREAAKGHFLPDHMEGGPANPLGSRALYLGSTLYRIHGTNAPWTIGRTVSSGCIRMRNEDVQDLYAQVGVGTNVVVR